MDDTATSMPMRLRQRAARCRDIAWSALSEEIVRELLMIADQYEREADELEKNDERRRLELHHA